MASKQDEVRREKRSYVDNYDELITYLDNNKNTELPFVQQCWDKSVDKCNENKIEIEKFRKKLEKTPEKVTQKEQRKINRLYTNPVRMYFKLIGLNAYKNIGKGIRYGQTTSKEESLDSITLDMTSNDISVAKEDEIIDWINMFAPDEREFLLRRYASYMDTYDINAGADRAMFKRLLSLEIEGYRIDINRAKGLDVNITNEKKLNEMIQGCLEANKWTKKQRNARDDMSQNRFTVWMDNMTKQGKFVPNEKEYPDDEIDYILKQIMENTRRLLS